MIPLNGRDFRAVQAMYFLTRALPYGKFADPDSLSFHAALQEEIDLNVIVFVFFFFYQLLKI